MTKRDLVAKLREKFFELEERDLEFIVDNFFEILKSALKKGDRIELRGFGIFELSKTKPYFFTNPKNQQKYYLNSKVRVVYKIGKEFKERLNTPFLAGLDLGTQTFRLLLGKFYLGEVYFLKSIRENVRLGEGLAANGRISPQAEERGLSVLKKFKEILKAYQVKDYYAIGTAIFRKAKNAKEVLERIERETSFKIEVLSPEKEAQLVIEGVLYGLKRLGL
ncbi:MAG: HU family DNA-binding protein, partial [Caldimicrobium sp.]